MLLLLLSSSNFTVCPDIARSVGVSVHLFYFDRSSSPAVMDAAAGSLLSFLESEHAKRAEVCVCVCVMFHSVAGLFCVVLSFSSVSLYQNICHASVCVKR